MSQPVELEHCDTFEATVEGADASVVGVRRPPPRSTVAAPAMPVFAWLWRGNAQQGFADLALLRRP